MEFTDEEKDLIRLIFRVADAVVEIRRESNYDVEMLNTLFNVKEKLGINGILEG